MVEKKQRCKIFVLFLDITVLSRHDGQRFTTNRTEKEIRFAERKIRPDGFGSTSTRPGRNLTRTFPKTEPKFGLQNLPNAIFRGKILTGCCHATK